MKPRQHLVLYSVLGVLLIAAAWMAVDGGLRWRRSEQILEEAYAQRLSETQEHLQAIALKLQKAPVAADARTQVELLTGVSRQADGVVSGLSALPLSHAAMGDTIKFCNQLSEYTLGLALTAASGAQLPDKEWSRLDDLRAHCTLLVGQFATAQQQMTAESLRLSADGAFYETAQLDARPLERVSDADHGMDYPSMIYDGAFSDARHLGQPKALGSRRIDQAQAIDIARNFVGADRVASAEPGVETGGPLESWGVVLTLVDGTVLNADVTRQGGQMLWIMPEHASFTPALTLEECTAAAQQFLLSHGYGRMEPNHYQIYNGLAVINFVAVQDGVLLYPDLIKVQLRMDTGELVGLEANNYLMNHTLRAQLQPLLSEAQARERVNGRLAISEVRLCVIPYRDGERLCWEAIGMYQEREYCVYVDAVTGEEAEVLLMVDSENGRLSAAAEPPFGWTLSAHAN